MLVGYARTSTADQTAGLAGQERELRDAGAEKVFSEQVSSVASREQLDVCLAFLREGDCLVVAKPDRLARNTQELLKIRDNLKNRKIGLLVLSMGGLPLDTRNPTSDLMLTVLAAVAQWERQVMLERQHEGVQAAKAKGVYKGRVPTARRQTDQILALVAQGLKPTQVAEKLGIGRSSVYRVLEGADAV